MKISRQKNKRREHITLSGHDIIDQSVYLISVTWVVSDMVVVMNTENGVRKFGLLALSGNRTKHWNIPWLIYNMSYWQWKKEGELSIALLEVVRGLISVLFFCILHWFSCEPLQTVPYKSYPSGQANYEFSSWMIYIVVKLW